MDEQTKRRLIRGYFGSSLERFFVVLIIIGILFMLMSMTGASSATSLVVMIIAVLFLVFGILGLVKTKGRVSDQQIDEWFEDDLERLEKVSLNKLGIDETELISDPVPITGMSLWSGDNANIMFRKGKDGILRFTPIEINILNFTQNQLLIYRCVFDFATGRVLDERTEEYFYKDIVSISTKVEHGEKINTKKFGVIKLNAAKMLTLVTSGGTSLSVLLYDPMIIKKLGGGKIPTIRAEKAIQVVRKMLRDKKV